MNSLQYSPNRADFYGSLRYLYEITQDKIFILIHDVVEIWTNRLFQHDGGSIPEYNLAALKKLVSFMPAPVTPLLAADTIIELIDRPGKPIVLIERRNPPPGWAIPGGFVDVGEHIEQAAVREAQEETALDVTLTVLLGVYSDPRRDARGHTVSVVYVAMAQGTPCAQDDAAAVGVFSPENLPLNLAFDHHRILADYLAYRRTGKPPVPRVPG